MSAMPQDNCAVKIAVREGLIKRKDDKNEANMIIYPTQSKNVIIVDERPFTFDYVMDPTVSQQRLFDDLIRPLVARVKMGFNCTVLAYGQTGTGKSYTMGLNLNNLIGEHSGIIPRCLKELFKADLNGIDQRREISASCIEIYNEKVYDMLSENFSKPLEKRGCRYTGGTCKILDNITECENILMQGIKNRHVRPTKMNAESSRSHVIFTIHIQTINGECCTSSCLNLVDLAGSEGVRRTGHKGMAMSEGVNINQGLLCIGKVLDALTEGNKVIPYRDSALSLVLQDSLNPNSYVTLLACISPRREDLSETLATLRFAKKAKQLKQNPHINLIMAEIKKNKAKSFHATRAVPGRTPYSGLKRLGFPAPLTSRASEKKITKHGNTFCTPNKLKRMEKLNRAGMDIVTAQQRQQRSFEMLGSMHPANGHDLLFDSSLESHNSLMSLNMSSSTTISYSPVVRKCLAEVLKPVMETTIREALASFTKEFKLNMSQQMGMNMTNPNSGYNDDSNVHSHKATMTSAAPIQESPRRKKMPSQESYRRQLNKILRKLLTEDSLPEEKSSSENSIINENGEISMDFPSITQNSKCQLFTTSSPKIKIPYDPPTYTQDSSSFSNDPSSPRLELSMGKNNSRECAEEYSDQSERFMRTYYNNGDARGHNMDDEEEASTSGSAKTKGGSNSSLLKKALRRSRRVAQRMNSEVSINLESSNTVTKAQHNRRSTRKSVKVLHDESFHKLKTKYDRKSISARGSSSGSAYVKSKSKSSQRRSIKAATKIDNIDNNSYYIHSSDASAGGNETADSPISLAEKEANVTKHRKAILEMFNNGSLKTLQILPQVGPKTAYQIVTHRALNGKFKDISQLEKLPIWRGKAWQRFAEANFLL